MFAVPAVARRRQRSCAPGEGNVANVEWPHSPNAPDSVLGMRRRTASIIAPWNSAPRDNIGGKLIKRVELAALHANAMRPFSA